MKRLLTLTIVTALTVSAIGCQCRPGLFRGARCQPAPISHTYGYGPSVSGPILTEPGLLPGPLPGQ